jgi:hypothetical protein
MNLSVFAANGDFSQSSLSIFGKPSGGEADNTGTARMFERRGRDRGASSAAAENAKDLWRAPKGQNRL